MNVAVDPRKLVLGAQKGREERAEKGWGLRRLDSVFYTKAFLMPCFL